MDIDPIVKRSTPAALNPPSYLHHHGLLNISSITVLLIVSVSSIAIIVISFSLFLLFRRVFNSSKNTHNNSLISRNGDVYNKQLCVFPNYANPDTVAYSPDVRSCIYGRKMGLSLQVKYRGGQVFTYRELEEATEGFSKGNVVGNGASGVFYRGVLGDGTVAAIKVLNREGRQGEREFRTQVDLMSQLHSSHVVGLLGYCADHHHRLLVFEFMTNGSLQCLLHPAHHTHQHKPLDWWTRLRIALDCARGLEFLHEQNVPAVIHSDFKCNNILLDHDYRAKISNFRMAKFGSDKINGQVLTSVLGTTGYLAPEYASTGKLTTKSDVYSFGVVLLELLTGRIPVDTKRPPGQHLLVSWALPRLTNREKLMEMVDPSLQGQSSKKELIQVAAIAAVCVQTEADYRPLMTDVVQSLIPLVRSPILISKS